MATPSASKAYLNTGQLSYNCTNLALAYPHGGTALGLFGNVVLRPPADHTMLIEEETGAPSAVLWLGGPLILAGVCKGWDADALAAIWPSAAPSGSGLSGDVVITWPGSGTTAGEVKASLTNVVFTATNTAQNHPSVILYNPTVVPDVDTTLNLTAYRYLQFRVLFIATNAGTSHGAMGRIGDLSV